MPIPHLPPNPPEAGYPKIEDMTTPALLKFILEYGNKPAWTISRFMIKRYLLAVDEMKRRVGKYDSLLKACKELVEAPHYEHWAARLNDQEMAAMEKIITLTNIGNNENTNTDRT
jgi:hypothetical protein